MTRQKMIDYAVRAVILRNGRIDRLVFNYGTRFQFEEVAPWHLAEIRENFRNITRWDDAH